MGRGSKFTRVGGTFAAVYFLMAVAPQGVASADQDTARKYDVSRKYFVTVPTPTIEAQPFASPYAVPKFELGSIDSSKFRKEVPTPSFDTVDLGKSTLRFDLTDVGATRALPGTPDLTDVIVPIRPGKKRSTPRFFGFALTTPTY